MRGDEANVEAVSLPGAPFSRYYAQESADEGIIMETTLNVSETKDERCSFMNKGQIRVRIEWNECHMLFQATYHRYDDVCRIHNQQMRREIATLQDENYTLERQLFSYQKSLAFAQAQEEEERQQQQQPTSQLTSAAAAGTRSSHHHALEHSTSTDTEYA